MKIAIMAGGTGGHIFPGIAVAKELQKRGVEIVWLGSVGGMEENIVKKQGIQIELLAIKGFRGKGFKGLLTMPFKLMAATWHAMKFLRIQKVSLVISMGGFVAAPGGLAAFLKRIPLVVHEQNSKFGMTNRYLSKWAKLVLTGFNLNQIYKSRWVGNPVRLEIEECVREKNITEKINILIVGGSLGARSLNTRIPEILNPYLQKGKITVNHQCGRNNHEITKSHYRESNDLRIVEFIENMCAAYQKADFIIARAGALTVAEINAVGLPAVFIPFPYAVDDHQTSNAMYAVKNKAAYIWQESESEVLLQEKIGELISNQELRNQMAECSGKLHKTNCASVIAGYCMEIAA